MKKLIKDQDDTIDHLTEENEKLKEAANSQSDIIGNFIEADGKTREYIHERMEKIAELTKENEELRLKLVKYES